MSGGRCRPRLAGYRNASTVFWFSLDTARVDGGNQRFSCDRQLRIGGSDVSSTGYRRRETYLHPSLQPIGLLFIAAQPFAKTCFIR